MNPIEILRFENHSRDESVFGDRWRDTGVKCYVHMYICRHFSHGPGMYYDAAVSNDITYHVQIANYKAPAVLNWKQLKE